MHPGAAVLAEVGHVTIAGARLDLQVSSLWHHLDRSVDADTARSRPASEQSEMVLGLAESRLAGGLRKAVLAAIGAAEAANKARNHIVHQDCVLQGHGRFDAVLHAEPESPEHDVDQLYWTRRSALESAAWYRGFSDSTAVVEAQTVAELKAVERQLVAATELIRWLTGCVASSREVGIPVGYVHPDRPAQ